MDVFKRGIWGENITINIELLKDVNCEIKSISNYYYCYLV